MTHDEAGARLPPTRRQFLLAGAAFAVGGLLLDATEFDRHHLTVLEHAAAIAHLPDAFHGFRIVQISDFHHRSYGEDYFLKKVVDRVNTLKPDMVALTGDFITADIHQPQRTRRYEHICAEILNGIHCPLRFCSLGNHDSMDMPGVMAALQSQKMEVLHNRFEALDRNGDRLWIAGLADAYFDAPDLSRAIPKHFSSSRQEKPPVVLLGHEPDFADTVNRFGGVDLMLAGHSHGGQIRIPGLTQFFLPDMARKYVHGAFQVGKVQLYVNRGIGTVHLPVRFRCPPEITVITLQPA